MALAGTQLPFSTAAHAVSRGLTSEVRWLSEWPAQIEEAAEVLGLLGLPPLPCFLLPCLAAPGVVPFGLAVAELAAPNAEVALNLGGGVSELYCHY